MFTSSVLWTTYEDKMQLYPLLLLLLCTIYSVCLSLNAVHGADGVKILVYEEVNKHIIACLFSEALVFIRFLLLLKSMNTNAALRDKL